MFKSKSKNAGDTLFPSNGTVRDRWGDPIGPSVRSHEFNRFGATDAAARMRWSLGHH